MKKYHFSSISRERVISFEEAHDRLSRSIREGIPYAMGKLGGTETRALFHADRILQLDWPYSMSWRKYANALYYESGFFPVEKKAFYKLTQYYKETVLPLLDYLYLWQDWSKETLLARRHARMSFFSQGYFDDFVPSSWLQSLCGKKVVVISPFSESITTQYQKREQIWRSIPGLLPAFELITVKAPMYSYMVPPEHPSWMLTLQHLCDHCDALDYDVMIVGAGAWGLPLATHAKSRGKVGVHMGGATQLLFGIKGGRWDSREEFTRLYNEHWTYPSHDETPKGVQRMEGACYWNPN